MKVIQLYAPTSTQPEKDVEAMYEDISTVIQTSSSYYRVVMGDFNTELRARNSAATKEGQIGYKKRNHRSQILADFMEKEGFFEIKTFFKKQPQEN